MKYADKFLVNKVMCPTLISEASFAVDENSFFGNDKTTIIVAPKPTVLACLLNSSIIWWQLTKIAQTRQNGYYEIKPVYLRRLFFPVIEKEEETQLEKYGKAIIKTIKSKDEIKKKSIEKEIDSFVAKLFKLNSEDLSVILNL